MTHAALKVGSQTETRVGVIERYLSCLAHADVEGIVSLFRPEAVVHSFLFGDQLARDFYGQLLPQVAEARIELHGIFVRWDGDDTLCAHFDYHWKSKDGKEGCVTSLDLFTFDGENEKIADLVIFGRPDPASGH